jgi:hypothetical protein
MSSFGENLDEMAFMTVISLLGGVTKDQLSLILLLTTFDISRRKSLIKDRAAYFRKKKKIKQRTAAFLMSRSFWRRCCRFKDISLFYLWDFYNPVTQLCHSAQFCL